MTILSIVVLVTAHTLAAGQQHVQYGDQVATAARLGRDLLEEVAARAYRDETVPTNFGPEAGEIRTTFDDADDYHAYAEAAGTLADFAGNAYGADDQRFSRGVTVAATTQTVTLQPAVATNPATDHTVTGLRVVVTVRAADGEQWQFSRFIPEPAQ